MTDVGCVLVTGATGFVGSAIARALLAAGYRVRALARPGSPRGNLSGLTLEVVTGDICDASSVDDAMQGVASVIHTAADYRLWTPEPQEVVRTNVTGTRTVMEAAVRAKVARVVYTSSVATLAPDPEGGSADESLPLSEAKAVGVYKRSKVQAERLVEAMVTRDGLPAVIVNPSTPVGPRDRRPTPTGRIIVEAANGRMPAFVDTGLNVVHVDDVALGHVAALAHGRIGERYILGGENVLLADLLADIAELVGRKPPRVRLPRRMLYPLAMAAQMTAGLTKREPFITVDGLRMARYRMFFSSAKAQRELGYEFRPYGEGLHEAIDWFRNQGYLR